ncbi:MAG TPA: tetratricopeptide repeat protein, partial [Pyrinomonadaceae bacterium]|nr:tetratricopeptide repeat protein [Pyrinomonadaceae bacterium]
MRFTAIFLVFALFVFTAFGQKAGQPKKAATAKPQQQKTVKTAAAKSGKTAAKTTSTAKVTKPAPKKTKTIQAAPLTDEKTEFAAAVAAEPLESVNALRKFIADFPKSERIPKARELLTVARAKVADEKIHTGDADAGIALFKLAVEDAPQPMPEKLFGEVVSKFPYSLYFNGQRAAAIEVASAIESHSSSSGPQLIALANFYVATENGSEALRLADSAIKLDPNSSPAYQALGLAHRLNFELEESAKAYAKALELDPDSLNSKQSLAEMYRALGKADEAEKLYREMLAIRADDLPAQTGLILSLFDAGKQTDAEAELAKSLEATPKNVILLSGAAYWYAANGNAERAVELAQRAVDYEPRYIWSYIALARGLRAQQKPVDAERILIKARTYGNFPTVEYEIAAARLDAGFYRDAVEELQKNFVVAEGGIRANLGGRVERNGKTFDELL